MLSSLLAGVVGASLMSNVAFGEEIKLPERFKDYREKAKVYAVGEVPFFGNTYFLMGYDLDNDKSLDVMEFYACIPLSKTILLVNDKPLIYGFDKDGNKSVDVDKDELYIDKNMDGLNGNENVYILSDSEAEKKIEI